MSIFQLKGDILTFVYDSGTSQPSTDYTGKIGFSTNPASMVANTQYSMYISTYNNKEDDIYDIIDLLDGVESKEKVPVKGSKEETIVPSSRCALTSRGVTFIFEVLYDSQVTYDATNKFIEYKIILTSISGTLTNNVNHYFTYNYYGTKGIAAPSNGGEYQVTNTISGNGDVKLFATGSTITSIEKFEIYRNDLNNVDYYGLYELIYNTYEDSLLTIKKEGSNISHVFTATPDSKTATVVAFVSDALTSSSETFAVDDTLFFSFALKGADGSSGSSGTSGSSGSSGSSGTSGSSGSSGTSGSSGSSGTSGESGTSGSSGSSGTSGSSGSSGTSGESGTSGSSGSSGTSGIGGEIVGGEGVRITGSGTTVTPYTADTIYNSNLSSTLEMDTDVGGIEAGTTVADLTGKTMVDLFNDLLFPTVLPTYTTPSITTNGISSQTLEVGTTESINFTGVATKNDAGEFTSIRLRKNSSDVVTDNSPTEGSATDIPDQFGFTNNNNPNHTYTSSAFTETLTVPAPTGGNTSTSTTYDAEGDCNAGVVKKDNKGNDDTRSFGTGTNTPQAARTNLDASNRTITGVYPYWYGTSTTQPTISSIQDAISGGTANKSSITNNQNGTLTITFGASSEFLWFAHFENYATKQSYFVNDLNKGNFGASGLFQTFTTGNIDSPDGYWNGVGYKIYIGNYQTETTSFGSMQLRTSTV